MGKTDGWSWPYTWDGGHIEIDVNWRLYVRLYLFEIWPRTPFTSQRATTHRPLQTTNTISRCLLLLSLPWITGHTVKSLDIFSLLHSPLHGHNCHVGPLPFLYLMDYFISSCFSFIDNNVTLWYYSTCYNTSDTDLHLYIITLCY